MTERCDAVKCGRHHDTPCELPSGHTGPHRCGLAVWRIRTLKETK